MPPERDAFREERLLRKSKQDLLRADDMLFPKRPEAKQE